jgi:predicted dehydrogenase
MKKVKIGIIGTGVGIRTHLNGFRLFEEAEVVAICGSSLNRSHEFATKYNIPVAYGNYKELCDNSEIDLVCVTSPNRFHYDATKYAISKNKHIICEKPLSDNIEEVNSLAACVENYSKIAVVDHQLRFNPYINKIKELINNGDLGAIYSVKLNQQGNSFTSPDAHWSWSFDGNEGGGVRLAMASHFTDLIQYWFKNPKIIDINGYLNPVTKERKDANGNLRKVTASTICTAHINFENELNVIYSINAGSYLGSCFEINIFGSKGELYFSLQDKIFFYSRTRIGEKQIILVDGVYPEEAYNKISIFSGSFRYFAPLIIKAIQTNDFSLINNAATFRDAQYNVRFLDAIKLSANNGVEKAINQYV